MYRVLGIGEVGLTCNSLYAVFLQDCCCFALVGPSVNGSDNPSYAGFWGGWKGHVQSDSTVPGKDDGDGDGDAWMTAPDAAAAGGDGG